MLEIMALTLKERPARTFETGPVTRWIRHVSIGVTLLCTVFIMAFYWTLPETVPTHFNIVGEADAWGPRSSVWMLVIVFTAINLGMVFLSRHPRVFNYPGVITEDNAQTLYRAGEQMMVWLTAACALIYVGISGSMIWGYNPVIVLAPAMILMFGSLIVGLARMLQI